MSKKLVTAYDHAEAKVKKFIDIYDTIEARVLVASLVVTVFLIFAQIMMRAIINASLSWSEELARYIFIWQIWLGVSLGLRDNKHIAVQILYSYIKGKPSRVLKIVATLLCIYLCFFLAQYGWEMTLNAYSKNSLSAAMRAPLWVVYLALPFSCSVTGLRYILQLCNQVRNVNSNVAEEGN